MKARAGNTAWECAEYHHPDPSSMLRERGVQQSDPGPPDEVMRGHCVSLYFLAVLEPTTGRSHRYRVPPLALVQECGTPPGENYGECGSQASALQTMWHATF
jgi:hypothetical protein